MTDANSPYVSIRHEGSVGIITLDDPLAMNALSPQMATQFVVAVASCENAVRAIVLTGNGRAFCAGAKLGENVDPARADYDAGQPLQDHFHPMMERLLACRVPIVAAVNGVAAGGGMALALNCDLVVMAREARFVPAFTGIGLVPDCGISVILSQAVGKLRAAEILMLNETVSSERAFELGLANRVCEDAGMLDAAIELAGRLANGPTVALAKTARLLRDAPGSTTSQAMTAERAAQREAGLSKDHREGLTAFLEKRMPHFTGQ